MSTSVRTRTKRGKHPHDDAPDTTNEFRRIAAMPDGPEREELCQEVVTAWMPMAGRLARNFRDRGETLEDLEQVAALGLVKAVHRYDPERGCAFESYAVPTIVGEVKRHFRDHLWGVHVPRRTQELRNRVRVAHRQLSYRLDDRGPGVREIAEYSGLTEDEVRLGMEALESYSPLSLEAELPGADDGYALKDTLGAAEPGFDQVVYRESVKPRLQKLPERERRILYLRFFREMTQSCIAEQLGISQMHVSRLISRTCERIYEEVEGSSREQGHAHQGNGQGHHQSNHQGNEQSHDQSPGHDQSPDAKRDREHNQGPDRDREGGAADRDSATTTAESQNAPSEER